MPKVKHYYIREWRQVRGLTQEELSQRAGLRRATVNAVELGKQVMKPETLDEICHVLKINEKLLKKDPFRKLREVAR